MSTCYFSLCICSNELLHATAPKNNKTYTIKYRNVYNRTKLNQQRYFMVNDKFMDTQNAIAYGNKFSHFEYKWSVN